MGLIYLLSVARLYLENVEIIPITELRMGSCVEYSMYHIRYWRNPSVVRYAGWGLLLLSLELGGCHRTSFTGIYR